MNTAKLRSKRVIVPAIATVAVLAVGGTVWTATASNDVRGGERDRVGAAAIRAVGGGTVIEVETSDDRGEAYEVEVRLDDGSDMDVALDHELEVVSREADDREGRDDRDDRDERNDHDDRDDRPDADDRALSASERTSAEEAALDAVGGGTVLQVEASDDRGEAYEVEVLDADSNEWDVELARDYQVLSKTADN